MKLAMGLLYREFKKRGWLDRLFMTITIHDELVFEIHKSLVSEAVPVIEKIMCVDTVKNLGWVVPLKVDIEFGHDWTVPYNLTEMEWGKGGGDWEEWKEVFPSQYQRYLSITKGVAPPKAVTETEEAPHPDGSYVFTLPSTRLTPDNAAKLARIISRAEGKGTDSVKVCDEKGNDLVGGPLRVAFKEFKILAQYEGL